MNNLVERKWVSTSSIPFLMIASETPPNWYVSVTSVSNQIVHILLTRDVDTDRDDIHRPVLHEHSTDESIPAAVDVGRLCSLLSSVQALFKRAASIVGPRAVRFEPQLRQLEGDIIALRSPICYMVLKAARHAQANHRPFALPSRTSWCSVELRNLIARRCGLIRTLIVGYALALKMLFCPTDLCTDAVASLWNTHRQCRLHLIDLLFRTKKLLYGEDVGHRKRMELTKLQSEAQGYIDEVCASIPFLLVGDSIHGSRPTDGVWRRSRPPMLVGGLSLQWVLFTISILSIVPETMKQHMKTTLLWIGENLGVGQATTLAACR